MKKLIYILLIFLFLESANLFALQKNDYFNFENEIILKDIELEGRIIYDDDFDDTIIDYNSLKKIRIKTKIIRNKNYISELKKKDKRWHLKKYKIKKNDNLWKIAKKFGINHRLIIKTNNLTNVDMLKTGESIYIPSKRGYFYIVKKGDTLSEIAYKNKLKLSLLKRSNCINSKILRIGQRLFIPNGIKKEKVRISKKRKKNTKIVRNITKFIWPIKGRITSAFGKRQDPFSGKKRFHCGVDISANVGTAVKAAASGKVIYSGWKGGYGNVVILRHKNGYISVYGHNHKNKVKTGQFVKQGQLIARSGMTGRVTGAHLHFEIRKYVTPLNPMRFLK